MHDMAQVGRVKMMPIQAVGWFCPCGLGVCWLCPCRQFAVVIVFLPTMAIFSTNSEITVGESMRESAIPT